MNGRDLSNAAAAAWRWLRRKPKDPPAGGDLPDPVVTADKDGRRRVSWEMPASDGTVVIQHHFPDALRHHYTPTALNQDVPLYAGPFRLDGDRDFYGDVRYRWYPRPGIEVRGSRETMTTDVLSFFSPKASGLWVDAEEVDVDLPGGCIPPQPDALGGPPPNRGHSISSAVEQQLGNPTALDRVTFLIPNGWTSLDGHRIVDPENLRRILNGRVSASGAAWSLTIDVSPDMDADAWRSLKEAGGNQFTHIGCLTRSANELFTGDEAFEALDRIRVALNIALGRRTTCSLPVGWRHQRPVWTRWRSAPVDPYRSRSHWLDETIAAAQIREVVERVLDFASDAHGWEALRPAVAYYMAANVDVDVELSVAIPVSALQMLAYYRFVTDLGRYSNSKWGDLDTEAQLRLLLTDIGADLAVHPHFAHLTAVRDRWATTAAARDALGVVVKMRNVVTHPTRHKPARFSVYEWAEAGMHARYWLCLALLHLVGYEGQIADSLRGSPRWTGQLRSVPWATR
jgi:hypothetical protein